MEILGHVKNYEWGKLGLNSEVARLLIANSDVNAQSINENKPYAELWMGDHPSGPATIKSSGEKLNEKLKNNLSYLFKVLSIRKALSIQVHPNKHEAEHLHYERPDIYKDSNHKPELAIALTPFTALCGFRPYKEIYEFLIQLPPLNQLVNGDVYLNGLSKGSVQNIKSIYKTLMTSDEHLVKQTIEDINTNYMQVLKTFQLHDLFIIINKDFPNDVGVLSIFFLNVIYLQPGDAIYLSANEIHAYLQGDCVECMACSDNVIRAGLTPKYKDVEQLLSCLNYKGESVQCKYFKSKQLDLYSKIFAPPIKDFAVIYIHLPQKKCDNYELSLPNNASILLVVEGNRILRMSESELVLKRGSIVYLEEDIMSKLTFLNRSDNNSEDFKAYLATKNYLY